MKNQEYIDKLAIAIKSKYGEHVLVPIEQYWSNKKELEYKSQLLERNRNFFYLQPSY